MKPADFAVVGGNIAAMVAALELARGGNSVLLLNPTPRWGGHFGGLELAGRRFDLGMNFLEFTSFAQQSPRVETYSAETRNDLARFTGVIRDYVNALLDVTVVETPQTVLRGAFAPDISISNRFELLDNLPAELRRQIAEELAACCVALNENPAGHARNKLRLAEEFAAAGYRYVSLANHGSTLHELLFEPACRRILGLSADKISALLHRAAWMPLYYPETLLQHLQGRRPELLPTEFSYPRAGSFAAIVLALERKILTQPGLELHRGPLERLDRAGAGWRIADEFQAGRLVWALSPGQLSALFGGTDDFASYCRSSVQIAFATVEPGAFSRRFSSLFVADADSAIYRITDQSWSAGDTISPSTCTIEISVEGSSTWQWDNLPGLEQKVTEELARVGVLREARGLALCAGRKLSDAIISPTPANRQRALEGHRQLAAAHPEIELIGGAAPFGAGSFNDHLLQGLRLAQIHRRN